MLDLLPKQMFTLIEAGHYYKAKGPTEASVIGWDIGAGFQLGYGKSTVHLMQMIDDVHAINEMHPLEAGLNSIDWQPSPEPNSPIGYVNESTVEGYAREIIDAVVNPNGHLSKKKKAKINGGGIAHLSTFSLTDENGFPNCVSLDAGLTILKACQGYELIVNVLPYWYEEQQQNLHKLADRGFYSLAMNNPEQYGFLLNVQLVTMLFDKDGVVSVMQPKDEGALEKFYAWVESNSNSLTLGK